MPPCGGAPYLNASIKNPKRCCASSGVKPSASNIFACNSESLIRSEPPPTSLPSSTISYATAHTAPGSDVSFSMSSGRGIVKGWCIATQRCSSLLYSNIGKSVIQSKHGLLLSIISKRSAKLQRSAPSESHTTLFSSLATSSSTSPGSAPIASRMADTSSGERNFSYEEVSFSASLVHARPFAP